MPQRRSRRPWGVRLAGVCVGMPMLVACGAESAKPDQPAEPPSTDQPPSPEEPPTSPAPSGEDCFGGVFQGMYSPYFEGGAFPAGTLGDSPGSVESDGDSVFSFQVKEDHFHTCRPLSYVVISGSLTSADGTGGTGGSLGEMVVLFDHGEMIAQPAPFHMKTVASTTQTSDETVEVVYGHAGGATAEGVTEYYTFTFELNPAGLTGHGALPEGVDGDMRVDLRGLA